MSRALAFLADPALAASVLPAPGRVPRPGTLPPPGGEPVPDRRDPRRGRPRRAAVRVPGQRTPLHRLPGRQPDAGRAARPAPAHGAGRGHPDLPGARAVLARRLRRQGHPDHHRRPRRSAAPVPLGSRRRPGHHGHLRRQDLAARHHRPPGAGSRVDALRHRRRTRARPAAPHPPSGADPRNDQSASRPARPRHPQRPLPRHRTPADGLERPRLQGSPARQARDAAPPTSARPVRPRQPRTCPAIPGPTPPPTPRRPVSPRTQPAATPGTREPP